MADDNTFADFLRLFLRAEGRPWAGIATALGGTAQVRRKPLARALDQVDLEDRGDT
jgi:hypothetical protein